MSLLPRHRHELELESGISPKVIARRIGTRSVTTAECLALGFADYQAGAGWVHPIYSLAGVQVSWMLKPDAPRVVDDKTLKYEMPVGSTPRWDCHPDAQPLLADVSVPLFITEGIKKADAMWSRGVLTVALPGVWQFLHDKMVAPDLREIVLKGRHVYLTFDSDVTRKTSVARALYELAYLLDNRGAIVHIIYLPEGPDGQKVGADDFLAAGGTMKQMLALAEPWDGQGRHGWLWPREESPEELRRQRDAARDDTVALARAILNPELTHSQLKAMVAVATVAMNKQAEGKVTDDGRPVLSPAEISDDYRPKPAKGESTVPINPESGTKPRMPRSSVRPILKEAVERGLLRAEIRPVIRQRGGEPYRDWEWVIDPVTSFAALLDPWANWRPEQPKHRKVRESRACPSCGEVHPIQRVDYCTGCGAKVNERTIAPEQPCDSAATPVEEKNSAIERTGASGPPPTSLRNGGKKFFHRADAIPEEPEWLADAFDVAPEPIELDMSPDDDDGLDAPALYDAQEALQFADHAAPDDARRARQDIGAQLERVALSRGRQPVRKSTAPTFTPPDRFAEYAPMGTD